MGQEVIGYGSAVNDGTGDPWHVAAAKMDAGARNFTVEDKDLSTPPGTPNIGDAYIVGASATGAWVGKENNIAVFGLGSTWRFIAPVKGMIAYAKDEDTRYEYTTSWVELVTGGGGSGGALVGTTLVSEIIAEITPDNTASSYTVDVTGYNNVRVIASDVTLAASAGLHVSLSKDGGSTAEALTRNYTNSTSETSQDADSSIDLGGTNGGTVRATVELRDLALAVPSSSICVTDNNNTSDAYAMAYLQNTAEVINALVIAGGPSSTTNLTGGTIIVTGEKTVQLGLPSYYRGALVKKSANQTAADYTTPSVIAWDEEVRDTHNIHDNATNNSRLTVPAGVTKVRLGTRIQFGSLTNDETVYTVFLKNGSAIFDGNARQFVAATSNSVSLTSHTAVLDVTEGDYFEVQLFVETDTSVDITTVSWFEMEIIEPLVVPTTATIFTLIGTAETLALEHAVSGIVEMNNASANTLTIPAESSVDFPIGTVINVTMLGAGTTTIQGATGVTVNGTSAGSVAISAQYGGASLYKRAADEWIVQGALA